MNENTGTDPTFNHGQRSSQTQSTSYSVKAGASEGKRSLNASNGMPVYEQADELEESGASKRHPP